MILLLGLILMLIIIVAIAVFLIGVGGATFVVVFSDLIVCAFIIGIIIKKLVSKKK